MSSAPATVMELIGAGAHVAGRADHRKPLWTLIAFQRWAEAWKQV